MVTPPGEGRAAGIHGPGEAETSTTAQQLGRLGSRAIRTMKKGLSKGMQRLGEKIMRRAPAISRTTPGGLTSRVTTGRTTGISFPPNDRIRIPMAVTLSEVQAFDVVPKLPFEKHPLSEAQLGKTNQLIIDNITQKEDLLLRIRPLEAEVEASPPGIHPPGLGPSAQLAETRSELEECEANIRCLTSLREKSIRGGATRQDYRHDDWHGLDLVNFELTKDHMVNLNTVFQDGLEDHNQRDWGEMGVNRKEAMVAETLAKALAYTEGLDGKSMEVPVITDTGESRLVEYNIRLTVVGDNLPCYILESADETAPPWFVARGTEIVTGEKEGKEFRRGAEESILADVIDPNSVGARAITKASTRRPIVELDSGEHVQRQSLNELFGGWYETGKQVKLAGHSLGGYMVTDLAIRHGAAIANSYGFSSPGLGDDLAAQYDRSGIPEGKVVNFDIEGDVVPSCGRHFRGLHLATSNRGQDPLHTHLEQNLNNPEVSITRVDNRRESRKLSRRVMSEGTRTTVGRAMKGAKRTKQLFTMGRQQLPDWEAHRRRYRRGGALNQQ